MNAGPDRGRVVFLDPSGRRGGWTRRGLRAVVLVGLAAVAALVVSLLGGVPLPGLSPPVPLPGGESARREGQPPVPLTSPPATGSTTAPGASRATSPGVVDAVGPASPSTATQSRTAAASTAAPVPSSAGLTRTPSRSNRPTTTPGRSSTRIPPGSTRTPDAPGRTKSEPPRGRATRTASP